ncbi:MFS transporter [Paenibacillus aceris]|uniref:AAHS family benzoate transporter-like MFS transporter n=1 Tax=Paenibacillus aceris TaxID=869555 RepID=A0ABS4I268_9BACL|nr:aromatic acid/H+ symport family MFS transporter [Paenibacillus aceris]MBP1965012.1 AAHS family benzoate transporter-like MFS transporter [Paenibacillus aceris]
MNTNENLSLNENSEPAVPLQKSTRTAQSLTALVVVCCFLTIMAEGYDLGIYGAVISSLLADKTWTLTPVQAGLIGSYALIGMIIGNVIVGTLSDLIGRKWSLITCIGIFSISMGLSAMATSPEMLGVIRFVGGISLGGAMPIATTLTIEYAPIHRRSLMNAIMFSGYPIGGILGAVLSLFFLNDYGWRFLFWLGLTPIVLVPFLIWKLPESVNFLVSRNRKEEAEVICKKYQIDLPVIQHTESKTGPKTSWSSVAFLFSKPYLRTTAFFWVTFFMGLLLVYGLSTWLPKMMVQAGYPLGSSLSLLVMLNFTAAIGALGAGAAADRWGSKRVISIAYIAAAVSIALLSLKPPTVLLYPLIGIAGIGSTGILIILNAYLTKYFPTYARSTALGWASGVGRIGASCGPILGGLLLAWKVDFNVNFYIFALAALIASISILLVPVEKDRLI